MADSGFIKEFLAAVGFNIDEAGFSRFQRTIAISTTGAITLGKELTKLTGIIVAAGAGVAAATLNVADRLTELYYVSQRTNESAQNIKAFSYAMSQAGVDSRTAVNQLEMFGRAVRDLPNLRGIFASMTGGETDPTRILKSLAEQYRVFIDNADHWGAAVFRRRISEGGFDPEVIFQMAMNLGVFSTESNKAVEAYARMGLDYNKETKNAVEVTRKWGEVVMRLSAIWDKLIVTLFPLVQQFLVWLEGWLKTHDQDIKKVAEDWATWLEAKGLERLKGSLDSVGDALDKIWTITKWMANHPELVGAIFGGMVGASVGGGVGAIVGAVAGMTAGNVAGAPARSAAWNDALSKWQREKGMGRDKRSFDEMKRDFEKSHPSFAEGGIVSALLHAGEMVLPRNISQGLQSLFQGQGPFASIVRGLRDWWQGSPSYHPFIQIMGGITIKGGQNFGTNAAGAGGGSGSGGAGGGGGPEGAARELPKGGDVPGGGTAEINKRWDRVKVAMEHYKSQGLTTAQAAGVVGWLFGESKLNPNAVNPSGHRGIMQWDTNRWANFLQWSGGDTSFQKQLDYSTWEQHNTAEKKTGAWAGVQAAANAVEANRQWNLTERGFPPGSTFGAADAQHIERKWEQMYGKQDPQAGVNAAAAAAAGQDREINIRQQNNTSIQGSDDLVGRVISTARRHGSRLLDAVGSHVAPANGR